MEREEKERLEKKESLKAEDELFDVRINTVIETVDLRLLEARPSQVSGWEVGKSLQNPYGPIFHVTIA